MLISWLFPSIFLASALHIVEEYFLPGGFLAAMKRLGPRMAGRASVPLAVVVNGLFLLLALSAALFWRRYPVFALSIAALCLFNAFLHLAAAARFRGYAPGLVTAALLYVPLGLGVYAAVLLHELVSRRGLLISLALGVLYHGLVFVYLGIADWIARRKNG